MFNYCVFHSNRFNMGMPACEGRHPDGQKRLPVEESRVVPLRRGFLYYSATTLITHSLQSKARRNLRPSPDTMYNGSL